jgi:hypothetical protein
MQKTNPTSLELARLIEENLSAKGLDFASLPGGQLHTGNPTWFTSGLTRAGYNGVTWANFAVEHIDEQIEAALEPFRQTNLPLTWWVGPLSGPKTLTAHLQAHGFVHIRDMIGMAASLEQLPPSQPLEPGYVFEPVNDLAGLAGWLPLFMETFGVPAADYNLVLRVFGQRSFGPASLWRHFLIRDGDQVLATSSLHFGAGVAGLYNIATLPKVREKGLGTTITLLTYQHAMEAGYTIGTLQSTYPNALRLYHRIGFEIYCKFGIYQRTW